MPAESGGVHPPASEDSEELRRQVRELQQEVELLLRRLLYLRQAYEVRGRAVATLMQQNARLRELIEEFLDRLRQLRQSAAGQALIREFLRLLHL